MSRRRRKSGPSITLFFFQDIIMSTSGIMIMIVLMLCLELLERPEVSASPTDAGHRPLKEQVDQIEEEISSLERRIANANLVIQTATETTTAERNAQTRRLQQTNRELQQELSSLQEVWARLESDSPQRQERRQELQDLKEQTDAAGRTLARLKRELQIEESNDRPLFSLDHGAQTEGWIVEVGESRILAAPIGRAQPPVVFQTERKGFFRTETAADAFLAWATARETNQKGYYCLFIRPGGADSFEALSESLTSQGISFGYDVANMEQTLLHPERGAGE